jgi:hypothetical protein
MILDSLFAIAAIGIVGTALFFATRPNWALVVVADRNGVRSCRGIPKLHEASLIQFLTTEIPIQGRVIIRGLRQKNGLMRLQVSGSLDSGSRQRIRNFLLSLL